MLPTTASAKTQPTRKAGPLLLARWLNSIKMTAMIGPGLRATPIAWGKIVPIAFPMTSFLRVVLERGMVRYVSRNLPLSSGPLLPRHRHVEQVFRLDEMVVAVGAEVDAHPLHGAGEGVVSGRVVLRHRRARIAADVRRLVSRERKRVGAFYPSGADLVPVDVEGGPASLAKPSAVVGELHAHLVPAFGQPRVGRDGVLLESAEAVAIGQQTVLDVQDPPPDDPALVDDDPVPTTLGYNQLG